MNPIAVLLLDLESLPDRVETPGGEDSARVLIRSAGRPLGWLEFACADGGIPGEAVRAAAQVMFDFEIRRSGELARLEGLADVPLDLPPIRVVVPTHDRTDLLAECLDSLVGQDYPEIKILVVDNAPSGGGTARLVKNYQECEYALEEKQGLDFARNRGLEEAREPVIAFIDDDAVAAPGWARAVGSAFARFPGTAAVTGPVVARELKTGAQRRFEDLGGFNKGFAPRWFGSRTIDFRHLSFCPGSFGVGCNMAFRTSFIRDLGGFDPALDCGKRLPGGGDLDMFSRVVRADGRVRYQPGALVLHRHRETMRQLRRQMFDWGRGHTAFLAAAFLNDPACRSRVPGAAWWWFWGYLIKSRLYPFLRWGTTDSPLYILLELAGGLFGPHDYRKARKFARRLGAEYFPAAGGSGRNPEPGSLSFSREGGSLRARTQILDLAAGPLEARRPEDVPDASLLLLDGGTPLGRAIIRQAPSLLRAEDALEGIFPEAPPDKSGADEIPGPAGADDVTVAVCTRDRIPDLEQCLAAIERLRPAPAEVLVVDSASRDGRSIKAVCRRGNARCLRLEQPGLSRAGNFALENAVTEIVAFTDDDVEVPPGWAGRVSRGFRGREDVWCLTGPVIPKEIISDPQAWFEEYGGLNRGFREFECGAPFLRGNFRSPPLWHLGAGASMSLRRKKSLEIGAFDPCLGPGTRCGCSGDTDFFYRVLRAGGRLRYFPGAWVLHGHRRTREELRHQLFHYGRGHAAAQWKAFQEYGDIRALGRLLFGLPFTQARRSVRTLLGKSRFPLSLIFAEAVGNAGGPAFWMMDHKRAVKRSRT